jgi:two-component system chemotaxis sensor kinase CheA
MDQMAAIKQTFFQECEEQLCELETGLLAIDDGDADPETLNAVFRAVHSIKGGAGAFSLDDLVHFSHSFESALDHLRAGRLAPSPEVLKTLLKSADMLADLVRAGREGSSADAALREELAAELRSFDPHACVKEQAQADQEAGEECPDAHAFEPVPISFDDLEIEALPSARKFLIRFTPKADLYAKANETTLLLRELSQLGEVSVHCDYSRLPLLNDLDPEASYLSWTAELTTLHNEDAVRNIFEFAEGDCELDIEGLDQPLAIGDAAVSALIRNVQGSAEARELLDEPVANGEEQYAAPQSAKQAGPSRPVPPPQGGKTEPAIPAQTTIRVDLERVDRLINLVGELVINQAMLAQRVFEAGVARASGVATGLDELEQLTREIQDSVMAIRAQPVKSVFQRMPRLVREVAALTGKQVRLTTEGENTEVDKTVVERLADPLTHMIRNAIDHGLESPEARRAAGKPGEGLVRLSALHRSGRIVIEVSDDGAGINRAKIKALAAGKGLIAPDAALTDEEIDNLIFLPGFSTAQAVSDISGRGVGMDVVRRSIQTLGGRISIRSVPGRGSTFTMSLPLTLAVLDGMVVTVAGETLVVPLTAIAETLQPKPPAVHGFGGTARVISIRNQFVPLIDVGRELGYRADCADPRASVAILVETEGHARSALLVDAILGQRQVVIKSLEANYRHVPGIAAATILGDGRVALILDVDAVVARSREMGASIEIPLAAAG